MLSEVQTVLAGSEVVGCLGDIQPVIVERGLVADDLERAVLERLPLAEVIGQPVEAC
jgi:hypothetical protein